MIVNGELVEFARETGWLCGCRDFEETRRCEHIVLASCWVMVRREEERKRETVQ